MSCCAHDALVFISLPKCKDRFVVGGIYLVRTSNISTAVVQTVLALSLSEINHVQMLNVDAQCTLNVELCIVSI